MFWVHQKQRNQVGSTANIISVGNNNVGRATISDKVIGGRVWDGHHFRGALNGKGYDTNDDYEVQQMGFLHNDVPFTQCLPIW